MKNRETVRLCLVAGAVRLSTDTSEINTQPLTAKGSYLRRWAIVAYARVVGRNKSVKEFGVSETVHRQALRSLDTVDRIAAEKFGDSLKKEMEGKE